MAKSTLPERPVAESPALKRRPGRPAFKKLSVQTIYKKVTWRQQLLLGLALALALFIILDWPFLVANFKFAIQHRNGSSVVSDQPPAAQTAQAQPDTLWVDSLGIEAPVKYVDQNDENAFQDALQDGVVHFPGTALPGQPGNTYIFGHSSDYLWSRGHYKTIFALLPQITDNAEIKLTDHSGKLYTYVVTSHRVIAATDTSVLSQYDNRQKLLTLQTSYPVGTALRRFVVVAQLKE